MSHQNENTLEQKLLMSLLGKKIIDKDMNFQLSKIECPLYQNDVKLLSKKLLEKSMVLLSKKILYTERLKCMTNKKLQSY